MSLRPCCRWVLPHLRQLPLLESVVMYHGFGLVEEREQHRALVTECLPAAELH